MKCIFIVNPVSGKVNATRHFVPKIKQTADAAQLAYEICETTHAGHATELARAYGETGERVRLYACGGDGTLNEVLAGAYPYENVEVGSIPCGSGNDFVRSFGTAADFLDLTDNLAGTAIPIDLIAANGGVCAAICSVGLDSEVAYGIPKFRRLPLCGGHMAYNLSIVERLCKHIGRKMRVEIDGQIVEDELLIATVCNGMAYGGGYKASPNADLQDGLLEVILVKKMSRLRIAGVLAKYKMGEHIADEAVVESMRDIMSYHKAKRVSIVPSDGKQAIVNIDGECGSAPALHAEVLPLAARFVLPARLANAFVGKQLAFAAAAAE